MDLKDFVSQTLLAISNGIMEAQSQSADSGLIIAPPLTEDGYLQKVEGEKVKPHSVHFNLKIVVEQAEEDGKQNGSFSIQLATFGLTAKGGDKSQNMASNSRIQEISFDIPVIWHSTYKPRQPDASTYLRVGKARYPGWEL